jgi:hypothetical protein
LQFARNEHIAIKIFAMEASSAASERNDSTFGFIHSKLRTSLATKNVQKLVIIKTINPQFAKTLVKGSITSPYWILKMRNLSSMRASSAPE